MKHKLFLSSLNLLWYKWLTDVTIPSVPARKIRANLKATNRFRSHPAFLLRVVLALPIVSTPGHASPACPKSAPTSPTNLGSSQCCQRGIFFAAFLFWLARSKTCSSALVLPSQLPSIALVVAKKAAWLFLPRCVRTEKNNMRKHSTWLLSKKKLCLKNSVDVGPLDTDAWDGRWWGPSARSVLRSWGSWGSSGKPVV